MSAIDWMAVMARITPQRPVDLDGPIFGAPVPETCIPWGRADAGFPPPAGLRNGPPSDRPGIGVRITAPLTDPSDLARRLAAAAIERGIEPVIITTLNTCGLEQFGFRVERVFAATAEARALQEAEIAAFHDCAIIIDAADVGLVR